MFVTSTGQTDRIALDAMHARCELHPFVENQTTRRLNAVLQSITELPRNLVLTLHAWKPLDPPHQGTSAHNDQQDDEHVVVEVVAQNEDVDALMRTRVTAVVTSVVARVMTGVMRAVLV